MDVEKILLTGSNGCKDQLLRRKKRLNEPSKSCVIMHGLQKSQEQEAKQ